MSCWRSSVCHFFGTDLYDSNIVLVIYSPIEFSIERTFERLGRDTKVAVLLGTCQRDETLISNVKDSTKRVFASYQVSPLEPCMLAPQDASYHF